MNGKKRKEIDFPDLEYLKEDATLTILLFLRGIKNTIWESGRLGFCWARKV